MSTQAIAMSQPFIMPPRKMDLASAVDYARKARSSSPFVGIATGERTVMLLRSRLKATLKGLRIIDAEYVDTHHSPISGAWDQVLVVHAVSENGRVKARRVFVPETQWKRSPLLAAWQLAEMRKAGRCNCYEYERFKTCKHSRPKVKESKHAAAIRKLQKEMPREWTPKNPAVAEMQDPESGDTRRHWHTWKLQKDARREIMALARRKDLTSAKLYAELAKVSAPHIEMLNWEDHFDNKVPAIYRVQSAPIRFKKWGELNTYDRRISGNDIFGYMAKLWQFCGLTPKPRRTHYEPEWGAVRYKEWLDDLRTRQQLTEQIAAIKAEGGIA